MIHLKKALYLQGFKANVIANGTGLCMILLIRVCVEKVDHLVGLNGAFQEEDQESTCPAHLQIVGQ